MPKYYCDYCDTFLTHDSPSVRKTHCDGRKHKENVKFYYQKWMEDQAQRLIDATTDAFKAGKLVHDIGTSKIFEFESSKSFVMIFFASRANQSGITKPFLNPNLMKASIFLSQNHYKESKQRFGELEFEYFGGSDVANKLKVSRGI